MWEPGSTLAELVDLVLAHLPEGLIGERGAAAVRAAAGGVPGELVARFALECPLAQTGDAEVLFCADSETGGMQLLAGRHPLVSLPASLATAARWAPVVRFCGRREPGCLLHRATSDVCVELARHGDPSVSFALRLVGPAEAPQRPVEVLVRALETGLAALRDGPLDPLVLTSLGALARRLPETARIDRAGLVAGAPDDVRLWLSHLAAGELVDLVAATRDGDEARRLRAALERLVQPAGGVRARVDVGDGVGVGVGRRIALVCTVAGDGSPPRVAARWRGLLDRLVEAGLCTDGKRDALLSCYGLLRERQSEHWPAHLTRLSELLGAGSESILQWRLQQIAIECDRGEPRHATARVVAEHGWSRR